MRIDARMFAFVPGGIRMAVGNLPLVMRFIGMLPCDLRIPKSTLKFVTCPTRFFSAVVNALPRRLTRWS